MRWLARSLYFPVFLQIWDLPSPVSRSQAHTHLLVPAAHVCARVLRLCFTHPESRGGRSAFGFGRIGNTPMRRHRLAGPHRTDFARSVVADAEGKIERRRARLG